MRRMTTNGRCAIWTACCLVCAVAHGEGPASVTVTSDLLNEYVWRGQRLNKEAVLQPGATVTYKGFTGGIWGNVDLTDIHDEQYNLTELDYSLGYAAAIPHADKWGYSAGVIYYDLLSASASTTEVYAGLSWTGLLSPSVTAYYDLAKEDPGPGAKDLTKGLYVLISVGHSLTDVLPLGRSSPDVKLGASLGWADSTYNRSYWGVDSAGFNDLTFSIAVDLDVMGMTVTPSVRWVALVDGDIQDSHAYSDDNTYVVAGVGLAKTF